MQGIDTLDIDQLIADEHNFNKGTTKGRKLMKQSLKKFGAGRSILVDKNGRIIAGNKTVEAATDSGIKRVRIIETDGTELVAVKRTDIDLDSPEGREMALADNATADKNINWDKVELENVADQIEDFNPETWGLEFEEPADLSDKVGDVYQIAIDCDTEEEMMEVYKQLAQKYKCHTLTL